MLQFGTTVTILPITLLMSIYNDKHLCVCTLNMIYAHILHPNDLINNDSSEEMIMSKKILIPFSYDHCK